MIEWSLGIILIFRPDSKILEQIYWLKNTYRRTFFTNIRNIGETSEGELKLKLA